MEESIYNLIPPEPKKVVKQPRYHSKYPHDVPPTYSTFGASIASTINLSNTAGDYELQPSTHPVFKTAANLGLIATAKPNPKAYTKKHSNSNDHELPSPTKFNYTSVRKPALPNRNEPPITGLTTTKNFVTANAVDNILMETRRPLDNSINWLDKEEYGKVPAYLSQVKSQIAKEYDMVKTLKEQYQSQNTTDNIRLLPEEERLELLSSLRKKWDRTNHDYQGLTHMVKLDTISKIKRKEYYESTLSQLEKDIERLDKKYVYVCDD